MADPTKPDTSKDIAPGIPDEVKARRNRTGQPDPNATKANPPTNRTAHNDYVVSVSISHPATSFTVRATFRLIDPLLCTDAEAYNGPALERLQKFIIWNCSL